MSGACSPGRSRGRSTVGRRHLAFQVAGLHREMVGWGGGGRRKEEEEEGKAGQKVSESMAANGRAAQEWYGSYLCNLLHMRATVSGWHRLHYDLLTHTHTIINSHYSP